MVKIQPWHAWTRAIGRIYKAIMLDKYATRPTFITKQMLMALISAELELRSVFIAHWSRMRFTAIINNETTVWTAKRQITHPGDRFHSYWSTHRISIIMDVLVIMWAWSSFYWIYDSLPFTKKHSYMSSTWLWAIIFYWLFLPVTENELWSDRRPDRVEGR